MKDPAIGVLAGLITALDGNIKHEGQNVPVFSSIPADAGNKYIYFDSFRFNEDLTKEDFGGEIRVDMQVVVRQPKGAVSRLPMHVITQEALGIIKPRRTSRIAFEGGVINLHTQVEDTRAFEEYDGDQVLTINIISLKFIYQEEQTPETTDYLIAEVGEYLLAEIGSKIKT